MPHVLENASPESFTPPLEVMEVTLRRYGLALTARRLHILIKGLLGPNNKNISQPNKNSIQPKKNFKIQITKKV